MSNQGSGTSRPSRYFLKNALRPLGMRWLGGKDIAFVLRNEKFYKLVKGPGWLFLVPLLDSVAFTTESLPDSMKEMFLHR